MIIGKLSSKSQITLPLEIRNAVKLSPGDRVLYEIQGEAVILKKLSPVDMAFHKGLEQTLDEWSSPEDDEAFGDL